MAGRGFGKTRTGAEWVIHRARAGLGPIAIIGETKADVRDVMVELGDSSILRVAPRHFRPVYQPSKRRLVFPNGVVAVTYSGDEPDQLRGPQHASVWVDELAKYSAAKEMFDNMVMGLRLSSDPRGVITTTPRPIQVMRDLVADQMVHVTTGTTYDNISNLSARFRELIVSRYEGTVLGRQELYAELLSETPGALWRRADIDALRVDVEPVLSRVGVGVDPSVAAGGTGDECGIVVAGRDYDGVGYVLADRTMRGSPMEWAGEVIRAVNDYGGEFVVVEGNQGGDMVRLVIQQLDDDLPVYVRYASESKRSRAEPIALKYERGLVHHVGGFNLLEDEMCNWLPGSKSPNRLDALVWILAELLIQNGVVHGS